ncbi:ABC transporter permease/M1 family aminopeptidase [Sediminitomix flava]|uniref:Peptidase M1-like protein n=1 Tax=Sediminitomix flava TaxID=379075 RepID=A0A315YWN9_SEDFL|nr:M1 family aminopeptidase [Sediminitomix flava]PWJ34184.1 peptidase M1-like protein [Sediminitomix flava]
MFLEIFLKEVKGGLKQPMVYVFIFVLGLLSTAAVVSDSVMIGGSAGAVFRNAPHIVTFYISILSIFGILASTAFFNNAALRDFNNQFNEILFSTPIKKSAYFWGRFLGAFFLATLPYLGVYLAFIIGKELGPVAGWMPAERFGPTPWKAFLNTYLLFVLPNTLFAGSLVFALASKFRSTLISFGGALFILMGYAIGLSLMSDIENETMAALVDMFAVSTFTHVSRYFTTVEKNTTVVAFEGLMLYNRLIWTSIGLLITVLAYITFSPKARNIGKKSKKEEVIDSVADQISKPNVLPRFGTSLTWLQWKSIFAINFRSMIKSNLMKILSIYVLIEFIANVWGGFEYFGLQSYPVTYKMLSVIQTSISILFAVSMVFYSGELVWRDREAKLNEVIDATPHNSFISLSAKAFALISMLSVILIGMIFFAAGYQLINGYTRFEFDVYFTVLFLDTFPGFMIWIFVCILIQVLVNHKYIAYFVSILIMFGSEILMSVFDVQSRMIDIGSAPNITYSDISGLGPGLSSTIWFTIYWVLFGLLALFKAGFFWNRGTTKTFPVRIKLAVQQMKGGNAIAFYGLSVLWIGVASFVYYNTQVLNPYDTTDQREQSQVDYEKEYKKYTDLPIPSLTDVTYHIDIFPHQRDVFVKADLKLVNKQENPIDTLLYVYSDDWKPTFEIPNSKEIFHNEDDGVIMFQLDQTLEQGDTIDLVLKTEYVTEGFQNGRGNTSIVKNGTFINNLTILPKLGYYEGIEISDKNKRKKYDLPEKEQMPELQADCSETCLRNYLSNGRSDWVNAQTFISTSDDQIAVAPGSLVKEWTKEGRKYYHYKVDHPSLDFASFVSAQFEVKKKKWNDVDIEIYYDKDHGQNVDVMIDAVERSLIYYSENFAPYEHKQARIIEFPRYSTFAQAFPGTMPYSEAFGFIINLEDETENNVIDAVIAHEMAHQWWAHQEIGAEMEGGTMLTEAFAEYSSLMVMKSISDDMKMKKFLKYDFNRYLRGRSSEVEKEKPLYKANSDQGYIHYGKGSVVLYALQDYIGEENVNLALRDFLGEFRYKEPPYPTSLDFLRHLEKQVPDSLAYLVDDWFKEITLYDFRLQEATVSKTADEKFRVKMKIDASKLKADSLGTENEVPINDWVDIGVYADADEEKLLYFERVKVDQKEQFFEFTVNEKPLKAAIDPRRLLIERVIKDNVKSLEEVDSEKEDLLAKSE